MFRVIKKQGVQSPRIGIWTWRYMKDSDCKIGSYGIFKTELFWGNNLKTNFCRCTFETFKKVKRNLVDGYDPVKLFDYIVYDFLCHLLMCMLHSFKRT